MKFNTGDYVTTFGGDYDLHVYNRVFYNEWLSTHAPKYQTMVSMPDLAKSGMKGTIIKGEATVKIFGKDPSMNTVYLIHTDDNLYFLILEASIQKIRQE